MYLINIKSFEEDLQREIQAIYALTENITQTMLDYDLEEIVTDKGEIWVSGRLFEGSTSFPSSVVSRPFKAKVKQNAKEHYGYIKRSLMLSHHQEMIVTFQPPDATRL